MRSFRSVKRNLTVMFYLATLPTAAVLVLVGALAGLRDGLDTRLPTVGLVAVVATALVVAWRALRIDVELRANGVIIVRNLVRTHEVPLAEVSHVEFRAKRGSYPAVHIVLKDGRSIPALALPPRRAHELVDAER